MVLDTSTYLRLSQQRWSPQAQLEHIPDKFTVWLNVSMTVSKDSTLRAEAATQNSKAPESSPVSGMY